MQQDWKLIVGDVIFYGAMGMVCAFMLRLVWRDTVGALIASPRWIARRLDSISDEEMRQTTKAAILAHTVSGQPLTRREYGDLATEAKSEIRGRRSAERQYAFIAGEA